MNKPIRTSFSVLAHVLFAAILCAPASVAAQSFEDTALVITIDGGIGPASTDYLKSTLETAATRNVRLVVIELDTPGGLGSAMRDMIKDILASNVPVATYVSPSGSRAASAGTYLLLASHIAAMAPETNLGSATPVSISGKDIGEQTPARPITPGSEEDRKNNDDGDGTAMERKVMNDAIAYIRGLAEKHGRNAEWAELAVRDAANLTAEEALSKNVIDLVATDLADLLKQVNGRTITVADQERVLNTSTIMVEKIERDWRNKFINAITVPTVAYMLMMVGIYGLMFEGYNPGGIVPGVIGAIAILLALYSFQILSVNYAGLALIALGVILMIAEASAPSFGVLGIGGIIAFVFGSIMLLDSDVPGYSLDLWSFAPLAVAAGLGTLTLSWLAVKTQRKPVVSGAEELLHLTGQVQDEFEQGRGAIWIHGERWNAASDAELKVGDLVRVTSIDGLVLHVVPADTD